MYSSLALPEPLTSMSLELLYVTDDHCGILIFGSSSISHFNTWGKMWYASTSEVLVWVPRTKQARVKHASTVPRALLWSSYEAWPESWRYICSWDWYIYPATSRSDTQVFTFRLPLRIPGSAQAIWIITTGSHLSKYKHVWDWIQPCTYANIEGYTSSLAEHQIPEACPER